MLSPVPLSASTCTPAFSTLITIPYFITFRSSLSSSSSTTTPPPIRNRLAFSPESPATRSDQHFLFRIRI